MTCCSPSRAVAMDPPTKHPMVVAVVAAAVAAEAVARAAVKAVARAAAAVLSDHGVPSLRSAHPHAAPRRKRPRQRSLKDATKLSLKMRVKREFSVMSKLSPVLPPRLRYFNSQFTYHFLGNANPSLPVSTDPGTPRSQSSVPMDESDSDAESEALQGKEPDEGENSYPVEGLYKSYEEKEEIMAMREFERERILEERHAERNRAKTLATLRQMVQNTEQTEKQKKRKAGAAELEEGQRKTSRPRTAAKTTKALPTALDTLKRARAEKQDRRRKDEERRRDRRSPSYRSGSSRSRSRHSDDSDVEWAGAPKKRSKTPERALPAELRDIERCRLSRTRFAKLNFWPSFEETMKGCYIRIHIGPDPNTRQPVYRMAVIKGELRTCAELSAILLLICHKASPPVDHMPLRMSRRRRSSQISM